MTNRRRTWRQGHKEKVFGCWKTEVEKLGMNEKTEDTKTVFYEKFAVSVSVSWMRNWVNGKNW